ncbi:guanylate kinase [Neisseriaceae bacterium ESL0693]|nr:guanylate kinase [Neisseriaceae bacterium ESL0693]
MSQPGQIFIVSAASGTGKTTLVSRMIAHQPFIRVSISHTTRPPRDGEQDGTHYHFVSIREFEDLIGQGAFLEHADVFGNYYGTSVNAVNSLIEQGFDVILEIDIQGAQQVRKQLPDAVSIFILPPSFAVLAERLMGRGTESKDVISRRLSKAHHEIEQAFLFDYVIINKELDQAEQDLLAIIRTSHLRGEKQQQTITDVLAAD